jgi:hypothetical protein
MLRLSTSSKVACSIMLKSFYGELSKTVRRYKTLNNQHKNPDVLGTSMELVLRLFCHIQSLIFVRYFIISIYSNSI